MTSGADISGSRASHRANSSVVSTKGFDPGRKCRDCEDGLYPLYGVAPHECFWRKGPEFTLGQSTLVPFNASDCFVPDLNDDEDWSAFRYPSACGVYYCPDCHRDQYLSAWNSLVARIGPPPASAGLVHEHAVGEAETPNHRGDSSHD